MRTSEIIGLTVLCTALVVGGMGMVMWPHGLPNPIDTGLIGCTADQRKQTPDKIFILHVPSNIFSDLLVGNVNCAASEACVFLPNVPPAPDLPSKPAPVPGSTPVATTGPDDDDVYDFANPSAPVAISKANGSKINWATPLDIDLDPDGTGKMWKDGKTILIKIVLENKAYTFLHDTTAQAGDPTVYAVRQGFEGSGMFGCVSRPRQMKNDPNQRWFITVRVFKSDPAVAAYGGLNIGVLVPITDGVGVPKTNSRNGVPLVVPVYVDPQIHNNG